MTERVKQIAPAALGKEGGRCSFCAYTAMAAALLHHVLELAVVQVGVEAARRQQLVVRAALDHVAVVHDENHVGVANRGEAVRDHKARTPHGQRVHGLLNQLFRTRIDRRGGLVENQNRRILNHGSRNGEQLLLTLRKRGLVVKHCVIAIRQRHDVVMQTHGLACVLDLLVGDVRLRIRDVFTHCSMEHPRILQHHGELVVHVPARHGSGVDAVDGDGAAGDLVEAHQQVDQGGFAAAGGADQGNALAGLNAQVHVFNQGHIRHIAELDMLKLHTACTVGQGNGIGGIGQDGVFVNKVEHTLRTGQGVLQLGHNAGNIIERLGVLVGIVQQNRKLADRNAAANGNQRAHHADRRIHQRVDKAGGRVGDGGKEGGLYAADLQIGVDLVKALLGAVEGAASLLYNNVYDCLLGMADLGKVVS